ncbi:MAG: hypothetical protein ACRD8O_23030 [Bryobacteraceae bacterium]
MKFTGSLAILGAAMLLMAADRFDHKVRNDFFAGMMGNREALERGMQVCEEILAANPKHAEALVWHGGGLFFQSGLLFRQGDVAKAMPLFERGVKEMDEAVALAPDHIGVRVPRGATLISATRAISRPEVSRPLLEKGVSDFEAVYEMQKADLDKLGDHPRGELLMGLADGHHRLGNEQKARFYFEKLLAAGKGSGHEAEAREWLATKTLSKPVQCVGCHVPSKRE